MVRYSSKLSSSNLWAGKKFFCSIIKVDMKRILCINIWTWHKKARFLENIHTYDVSCPVIPKVDSSLTSKNLFLNRNVIVHVIWGDICLFCWLVLFFCMNEYIDKNLIEYFVQPSLTSVTSRSYTVLYYLSRFMSDRQNHNVAQRARKLKKVQAKKLVKSNKSKKNFMRLHFWQF